MHKYTKKELMTLTTGKLRRNFGCDVERVTSLYMLKACVLALRGIISRRQMKTVDRVTVEYLRQVYCLSLEFLAGRSLMKDVYNLGVAEPLRQAIEGPGFSAPNLSEAEPGADLSNDGLGHLAACYLGSVTTLEIPAIGYSICHKLGIFKQKIVDGQQVELPGNRLGSGNAWLIPKMDEIEEVCFDGKVEDEWDALGRHRVKYIRYDVVLAVPKDMEIAGYGTEYGNLLRLRDVNSLTLMGMNLSSSGQYLKVVEQRAMAESIFGVLYPEDNRYGSKSLRLERQYFFVSITIQSVVREHRVEYSTLRNFHLKHVTQTDDTHPTPAIPELIRILLNEEGYGWDEAWYIVTHTTAYTNHTILAEALKRWPQQFIEKRLPRIWQVLIEISNCYQQALTDCFHGDLSKVAPAAIVWGGEACIANLCVYACFEINGVSALHSDILERDALHDAYARTPDKLTNVTNSIDHRRRFSEYNPELDALIRDCCGKDKYLLQPDIPKGLEQYRDDAGVLSRLGQVKADSKKTFVAWVARESGIILNTGALFDVQVKRLHEYERQLLNVLHTIYLYQHMKADPHFDFTLRTYLFGTKATPGYAVAKRIIRLINSVVDMVARNPICRDRLQVVLLENYRVSLVEKLMLASGLFEQISTAGKGTSGTSNIKFMMNDAVTIGALDGTNAETHQVSEDENTFFFSLKAHEVAEMKQKDYKLYKYHVHNPGLRAVIDQFNVGFGNGVTYGGITRRLLFGDDGPADEYLPLTDLRSYWDARQQAGLAYQNPKRWDQVALMSAARLGILAADCSTRNYTRDIWSVPVRALK